MTREFRIPPVPRAALALDLLGGVVIGAALIIPAWLGSWSLMVLIPLLVVVMPVAAATWGLFRMASFAAKISDLAWRESLAVTPGSAGDWLEPTMQNRLEWALSPLWVSALVALSGSAVGLMARVGASPGEEVMVVLAILLTVIHLIARHIVVGASYDMLTTLCRARSADAAPLWLPLRWAPLLVVALIGGPMAVLASFAFINLFCIIPLPVYLLGVLYFAEAQAKRKKAEAFRAYYEVDLSALTPLRVAILPPPRTSEDRTSLMARWCIVSATAGLVTAILFGSLRESRIELGDFGGAVLENLIVGTAQWFVLRRRVSNAGWWLPISVAMGVVEGLLGRLRGGSLHLWIDPLLRVGEQSTAMSDFARAMPGAAVAGALGGALAGWFLFREVRLTLRWAVVAGFAEAVSFLAAGLVVRSLWGGFWADAPWVFAAVAAQGIKGLLMGYLLALTLAERGAAELSTPHSSNTSSAAS